jgi:outer membrane murein-binding lipoprotein Lpp
VLWIAIAAWGAAAVVALVVLGFCAYEILWKTKRLQGDLRTLDALADQLTELRGQLAAAQERVAATGLK